MKKITDATAVNSMSETNSLLGNFGGALGQISLSNLRAALNNDDQQVLNDLAFYIDVNKASSLGSTRVDVGGNMGMRTMWEAASQSILMDKYGDYCELNRNDCRYANDGDTVVGGDGMVVSAYANCDFMKIIPETFGRVQEISVGATTIQRLWLSLVPLPGGFVIPQQVVGKFKSSTVGIALRSLPGLSVTNNLSITASWNKAQARSKNHGLANLDFRNYLLWYMMSKYAYRDSQGCKSADGSLVWGVGLDGSESDDTDDTAYQASIVTGKCLTLGDFDGNVVATDEGGSTCHCVNVAGFENPWGQYNEIVQGLCSVGTDVYCWRSNFMPTSAPTATTFSNIDCVKLTCPSSGGLIMGMNMITSGAGQGCYMVPKSAITGISYGDIFYCSPDDQLWTTGGYFNGFDDCGLACFSVLDWTAVFVISSRLAYYGPLTKVTAKKLAELAA